MRASCLIYFFGFLSIAAIIFVGNTQSSVAAGFGVSPSTLELTVKEGSESSRQLTIYNTGKKSVFSVQSSSPEVVLVFPSSGTLPEGGTAIATVTAFGKEVGTSESELAISFGSRAGEEVSVALGAVVAVNLNVVKGSALSANAFVGMLLSTSIVMFGLCAYYTSRKKIRQLLVVRA